VALGIGAAALGTDTGGSVRIPAALNGVVGFKPTARRVPLDGCVPLSFSLDSVGPLARSVADCAAVDAVIADVPVALVPRSLQGLRLLVVETVFMDGLDAAVATAFEAALSCLSSAGAAIERRPVRAVLEVADLQATGGFAAAESWAWHRHLMADRTAWYDPRVAWRIQRGAGISAADYIDLVLARRDWVTRMNQTLAGFDALLAPTVPILAPPMEAIASDEGFFRINTQLLRNPSIINFWDGCSISLPCQETGLPVGLMVSAAGGQDGALLSVAAEIERVLKKR
jgi:aspartyl-tRNA(Asn)/glutamyl-tRNA(Gln) amidotransferase subunit A